MMDSEPLPERIGRYTIKSLLGSGSMGSVYLAEDPYIKRQLAIKIVKPHPAMETEDRQEILTRFQREAEVSGLLNHPGIVTVYDVGNSDSGPFLAMEYIPGQLLEDLLRTGELQRMSLAGKLDLAAGIASALDHAHTHGIVHRDVKPGNVLITATGRTKLLDFGIAKREEPSLTRTGTFLGTPAYSSPEQIQEGVSTVKSDVFSFGVLVFQMLSGKLPFPGETLTSILTRIVQSPPEDVTGCVPEIPGRAWKEVFDRVLAKHPADRYDTCLAFVKDLSDHAGILESEERQELPAAPLQLIRTDQPVRDDALRLEAPDAFAPETPAPRPWPARWLLAAGAAFLAGLGGLALARWAGAEAVELHTSPSQVQVFQGGRKLGETPLALSLRPGAQLHLERPGYVPLDFKYRKGERDPRMELRPRVTEETVLTEPAGAEVHLDGQLLKGLTPLQVTWNQSERHVLTLTSKDRALALVFFEGETPSRGGYPLPAGGQGKASLGDPDGSPVLCVSGSFPVGVRIDGKDAGHLKEGEALRVPAGTHELELANAKLFYRETRRLAFSAGQKVEVPLPPVVDLSVETFPTSGLVVVDGTVTGIESDGMMPVKVVKGRHRLGIEGKPAADRVVEVQNKETLRFHI